MAKEIIYAETFLKKFDFFHLAKQFYKHIYRNKELEQESEWNEIKLATENYLVKHRLISDTETTPEDYRKFLRFYTEIEIKYEDPTEFVFNEREKAVFVKFIKSVAKN